MRTRVNTIVVVLALAGSACAAGPTASALASTGGAAASPSTPSSPSTPAGSPGKKVAPSGIATWFGPGFYGKQTACGQTLTPTVVGVANRTLPCGTLVSVGYEGRTLTVPVLDRGPYSHGVSWDLTAGAARALGIEETVRVSTHVVGKTANIPTLGLAPGSESADAAGGALAG